MKRKILIVDDEQSIADLVEVYLSNEGMEVLKCYNGQDALDCIKKEDLSLAVLDVMLPDIDGYKLCQEIRKEHFYPVIMLTARTEDTDKILGLTIDRDSHKCSLNGSTLSLTPREFSILWYLCENKGRVISSEELFEQVWGEKFLDNNNTVMAHIGRLREKMKDSGRRPKYIKTVWGVGYQIE